MCVTINFIHAILTKANSLKSTLPTPKQRGVERGSEKGALSWLVTTSLAKCGFNLHEQPFEMHFV